MAMRGGAKKSVAWNYFRKNPEGNSATCMLCKKNIKSHGGTSNLRQHLQRIHYIQMGGFQSPGYDRIYGNGANNSFSGGAHTSEDMKPDVDMEDVKPEVDVENVQLSSSPIDTGELEMYSDSNNVLTDTQIADIDIKLLKMITRDFQPLSILENKGFLEYSEALQPLYKPPSKKRLTTMILPKCYRSLALTLKNTLEVVKNVAITTDIWTSDSNISYITLTAHFIFDDRLQSRVLSTKNLYGSHTAENIANVLTLILTEWNINHKVVAMVCDNTPNVKKAVSELLQKHHQSCIAHILNQSVNEAISSNEVLSVVLNKCRALVNYFERSTIARDKLKYIQEQMGLQALKLEQDEATTWYSCYIMLDRILAIMDPLSVCITNLPDCPEFLDTEGWIIINDCVQVLKPVNSLTNIFSAETYPTISLIIPLVRAFESSLVNIHTCTDATTTLKHSLLNVVTQTLEILETNQIVSKATFLDPRFKKIAFGAEDNAINAEKWVSEELCEIVANQISIRNAEKVKLEFQENNEDDLWSHFDQKLSENKSYVTPTSTVALMVRQYLEMAPIERKTDPLLFWSKHKDLLPEMYQLAMKYLCIPSTSVPSETVFSKTGQLTNIRRNRLDPNYLDEIIFLNSHDF